MTPRRLHVLMVLESSYPAARGGGAEGQVRTLVRGLRRRGQYATVLTPRLLRGSQQKIARVDGVPVCRLPYPYVPLLGGVWLWASTAVFLWRRRHRYDAWHAHIAHRMAAVCALLGAALRKRVLVKVAGSWELERGTLAPDRGLLDRLAGAALRHASGWQAISRRLATTLACRGIPAARIVAVPNAVETARFESLVGSSDAAARFVFVGRMTEEKSLDVLLDAFARILPAHPDARLALVGSGVLEAELETRAQALGIAAQVEFAGHQDDIAPWLARANVGVQCSRIEGLSNTLLESMAAGLPIVASRISGNEDFVREGENGWVFEAGDRDGLAHALAAAAAETPARRRALGDAARATVRRQAGVEAVLTRLTALYRGEDPPAAVAAATSGGR